VLRDLWKQDDGERELLNINEIPHGGVEQEWWHTCFTSPWAGMAAEQLDGVELGIGGGVA
jgi:hypothetical protein